MVAEARSEGWEVAAEQARWAGWPASAGLDLGAVTVRGGANTFPPGLVWSAPSARLRLRALDPTELLIDADGKESVSAQGLPTIWFRSALFRVAVDLSGRLPARASLRGFDAALPSGALSVETAELQLAPGEWRAALAAIVLPGSPPPIEKLRFRIAAHPPFPPAETPADSARSWRDAGGRVTIDEASLVWSALRATLDASGGLGGELQPEGTGELVTTGLAEFLDALAEAGALTRPAVVAAKAVVTVLAAPAAGGPLRLPVSLRGGVLSVARVPLLRLAPVAWE